MLKYSSYANTIDGTQYCSGVETLAENLIEDNEKDSTIMYPSTNGWASVRPFDGIRLTTENVAAILPSPIYKIRRIYIKPVGTTIRVGALNPSYLSFKKDGSSLEYLDATKLVLDDTLSKTLSYAKESWSVMQPTNFTFPYGKYKDNTFIWQKNSEIIFFSGEEIKYYQKNLPIYNNFLRTLFVQFGKGYVHNATLTGSTDLSEVAAEINTDIVTDVRNWQFRIEYVPISSKVKLRARKAAKTTVDYMQPFNQRAEINAASAFGKNMFLTAQKTGVRELVLVKNYTRLADIPPLGALVRHNGKKYRLIANTYKQTNTLFMQVTHTLSENWSSRSKYVAVNQKYRNYRIPQEMLWRNMYREDFVLISTEPQELNHTGATRPSMSLEYIMKLFNVYHENDHTIDSMVFVPKQSPWRGVYVPCSTMGVANSIVISASMKDNLSAGLSRKTSGEDILCEEALYCKDDGTLEEAIIYLSDGIASGTWLPSSMITEESTDETKKAFLEAYAMDYAPKTEESVILYNGDENYQVAINMPRKALFCDTFYIDKDPGEALRFTYQIHFIPDGDLIVGNKIAEHNPLIKRWTGYRTFKVWGCKHYIRDGVDFFTPAADDMGWTQSWEGEYFEVDKKSWSEDEEKVYGETYTLKFKTLTSTMKNNGCVAWCITDKKNNIYLASNDINVKTVYFQMTHKR